MAWFKIGVLELDKLAVEYWILDIVDIATVPG